MNETGMPVVCAGAEAYVETARELAERLGVPLTETPGEALTLMVDADGISLNGYGMRYQSDFTQMLRRITNGHLQHEMLAHVSKTKTPHPKAVDATAGLGEDSLLLAACGYEVTMFEQNPVIAALLRDALYRAQVHPVLGEFAARMRLVEGNSLSYLPQIEDAELIYLDPMFPARQKSGLIGKKLQLIQKLEQPCVDEAALLDAAMQAHPQKIIIKRPLKGAYLAQKKPHYSVKGKAIRYDCFVFPKAEKNT